MDAGEGVDATWLGQDGQDITNPSQGVGPDGDQSVDIGLSNLSTTESVTGITLVNAAGQGWASWADPGNLNAADYRPSATSSTAGDFYFSPSSDIYGTTYTLTVTYSNGTADATTIVAGHTNPTLSANDTPAPGERLLEHDQRELARARRLESDRAGRRRHRGLGHSRRSNRCQRVDQ